MSGVESRSPNLPGADESGCDRLFLALIEIDLFEGLKRTIGYTAAGQVLATLTGEIGDTLARVEAVKAGRVMIEASFAAGSVAAATEALRHLAHRLERRISIDGYDFDLGLTIGCADSSGGPIGDELVGAAERALLAARHARPRLLMAEARSDGGAIDRLTLMRGLQAAIRDDTLSLHYQPKVCARSGRVVAAEALVRWSSPQLGTVAPDLFVPIAEETGDIRALTAWVVARAVADQRLLAGEGDALMIDVNISGSLLGDDDLASQLIEQARGATGAIGFEITETSMIADAGRALANLQRCADAGIDLAIDDYGAGFSSLAYLQQLPAVELKIDRSFISRLASHQRDPLLVRSTIDLAHALEMRVTAEGIESAHVLALLQVMGCDMLQGYHLARPMPLADLRRYLVAGGGEAVVRAPGARLMARNAAA